MKVFALCLLLAACSADPMDVPLGDSADAGVQVIAAPLVLNAQLEVLLVISYNFWDNALAGTTVSDGPVIPPVADWICPPMFTTVARLPDVPGPPPTVYYGSRSLSGATSRTISSSDGCGGTRYTSQCQYRFPAIPVASDRDVVVYVEPDKPCGHGSSAYGRVFAPPPAGTLRTAVFSRQGPYVEKAYWKEKICDSGCYACGPEWYSEITTMRRKKCTWNGQACVAPCTVDQTQW